MASLPVPSTSFIGRAHELAEATELLLRPDIHVLVMTGPGGMGKTRLALAAASAVAGGFRDGVVFVDLAPLTESARFLPQLAAAIGMPETNDRPLRDRLRAFLRTRRMLMVLDNFETVVAAAGELAELAAACRGVTWLVTSRVRSGVPGEVELPIEPLALPSAAAPRQSAALTQADAIRLFIDRAQEGNPAFAATPAALAEIVEICRRLDGIPLAVELAAARVRSWDCTELLARLDDPLAVLDGGSDGVPKRLRSMRDAVAWSYDLLSPDLRALARRLAVFRGGFDATAAEAVAFAAFGEADRWDQAASGNPAPLVHRLFLLVDHQWLHPVSVQGMPRYAMLEVVREFGLEQLASTGELATAQWAHAEYFLIHAERMRTLLFSRGFRQAMTALILDQHNARAALAWARETCDNRTVLRLANALQEFWYQCGFIGEGREWLETSLAGEDGTPAERMAALESVALLAWLQNDNAGAVRYYGEEQVLGEAMGSPWAAALPHNGLALVAWRAGDPAAIRRHVGISLPVMREAGDAIQETIALVLLAIADRLDGRLVNAALLFDQARRLAEQTGFLWLAAAAGFGAGEVALDRGNAAEAIVRYRESFAITAELGDHWGIGAALGGLACIAAKSGAHDEQAARLFAAADARLEVGRTFLPTLDLVRYDRLKEDVRRRLGPQQFGRAAAAGRVWTIAEIVAETRYVGGDGPPTIGNLTPRQREILPYLKRGLTVKEIARETGLTVANVNFHLRKLYHDLGIHSRAEAAAYAAEHHGS